MFRHHHSFLRGEEFYLQSSQDDGLFPVALKALLLPFHSREHSVSAAFCLTPIRICRLFHCFLSSSFSAYGLFIQLIVDRNCLFISLLFNFLFIRCF
ncbi:hypothetical protein NC651_002520 [Populus alba x Populus x berolinensis]|nr:hypothetical protein NC651_002520 [Populus alba x Populus x berolinensis]